MKYNKNQRENNTLPIRHHLLDELHNGNKQMKIQHDND